jgi:hypothetical protein
VLEEGIFTAAVFGADFLPPPAPEETLWKGQGHGNMLIGGTCVYVWAVKGTPLKVRRCISQGDTTKY